MPRIVIVGGAGAFGRRVVTLLARHPELDLVVAGRSPDRAAAVAEDAARSAAARIGHARLDAATASAAVVEATGARVVVNASGPFQRQAASLAEACIGAGCHYVDLADATQFVAGISRLDAAARAAGVRVISGASSVPGLSSAVIAEHAGAFAVLERAEIAISPGNSFDPGLATTVAVLSGLGRPILTRRDGATRIEHGWLGLARTEFPGLGRRWTGFVDVPDLTLFPERWPGLDTVSFRAGLEVGVFHLGLWMLAGLTRAGLVRDPEGLAPVLLAAKRRLSWLGSDRGGMVVRVSGRGNDGKPLSITWSLVAGSGDGPYVPAIPAALLARRLALGKVVETGAGACLSQFTTAEFLEQAAGLDIRLAVRRVPSA